MRARPNRVVLVALAAAGVIVGGSIAARHGPFGGSAPARHASASGAPADRPAGTGAPPASLDIDAQIRRLPPLARGELAGTLVLSLDNCGRVEIPLATLAETVLHQGVCAAPGARFGFKASQVNEERVPRRLAVVDLTGRAAGSITLPDGWGVGSFTRDGVVICDSDKSPHGELRLFAGGVVRLPSCPVADGTRYYAGRDPLTVVDRHGHAVIKLIAPISDGLRVFGGNLIVSRTAVYRHGRLLEAFDERGGTVLGLSRDGRVALVDNADQRRPVLYREGAVHRINPALMRQGGLVSPDGKRLLLQSGDRRLVEVDAVSLRPLAALQLQTDMTVEDWLPPANG